MLSRNAATADVAHKEQPGDRNLLVENVREHQLADQALRSAMRAAGLSGQSHVYQRLEQKLQALTGRMAQIIHNNGMSFQDTTMGEGQGSRTTCNPASVSSSIQMRVNSDVSQKDYAAYLMQKQMLLQQQLQLETGMGAASNGFVSLDSSGRPVLLASTTPALQTMPSASSMVRSVRTLSASTSTCSPSRWVSNRMPTRNLAAASTRRSPPPQPRRSPRAPTPTHGIRLLGTEREQHVHLPQATIDSSTGSVQYGLQTASGVYLGVQGSSARSSRISPAPVRAPRKQERVPAGAIGFTASHSPVVSAVSAEELRSMVGQIAHHSQQEKERIAQYEAAAQRVLDANRATEQRAALLERELKQSRLATDAASKREKQERAATEVAQQKMAAIEAALMQIEHVIQQGDAARPCALEEAQAALAAAQKMRTIAASANDDHQKVKWKTTGSTRQGGAEAKKQRHKQRSSSRSHSHK